MAGVYKKKEESKTESERAFKALVTYLKEMGMPAEKTYEQAIERVFEGSLDFTMKGIISEQIGEYIAMRLTNARIFFNSFFHLSEWDSEVMKLIIEVIGDFKDLLLPIPELEEISSLAADVLKAEEKWKPTMANGVKDSIRLWLSNTLKESEMMKKWAKNPTRNIESGFKFGRKFS